MRPLFLRLWTIIGLSALFFLAWQDPFTPFVLQMLAGHVPQWFLTIFIVKVIILRAFLMGEVLGHVYHRIIQHPSMTTRLSKWIRRSQHMHWAHHMIIYPYGRDYVKDTKYIAIESGFASWMFPISMIAVFFFFTLGNAGLLGRIGFLVALLAYYYLSVEIVHSSFHVSTHSWWNNRYFQWISAIHVLHHYDQRKNFSILMPALDILFGTYISPAAYAKEAVVYPSRTSITFSDRQNWELLLANCPRDEDAISISGIANEAPLRKTLLSVARESPMGARMLSIIAKTNKG